jgi:hypothetical protein
MDKTILEEIAERAKRNREGPSDGMNNTVAAIRPDALQGPSSDPLAKGDRPIYEIVPLEIALCDLEGKVLRHVMHNGRPIFIGEPGQRFGLVYKWNAVHAYSFHIGGIQKQAVARPKEGSTCHLLGYHEDQGFRSFMFEPLSIAESGSGTKGAATIVFRVVDVDIGERYVDPAITYPEPVVATLSPEARQRKFFQNPGLTVKLSPPVKTPGYVHTLSKINRFGNKIGTGVIFFETEERLRLRGILPPLQDDEEAAPSVRKRAKVVPHNDGFRTVIDLTGDGEPVVSRIKKEELVLVE